MERREWGRGNFGLSAADARDQPTGKPYRIG
jgi:hypothetical protein